MRGDCHFRYARKTEQANATELARLGHAHDQVFLRGFGPQSDWLIQNAASTAAALPHMRSPMDDAVFLREVLGPGRSLGRQVRGIFDSGQLVAVVG
eukprot:SAG11_NODE_17777_length_509_cov_0.960976_2_plen_95_part_01